MVAYGLVVHQSVIFSVFKASVVDADPTAMVIPAAYHSTQIRKQSPLVVLSDISGGMFDAHNLESQRGLLFISRGTSVLLLFVYVAYLFFQVRVPPASRGTVPPRHIFW